MKYSLYQEKCQEIEELICNKDYLNAREKLDNLYQYKPVRAIWFHLKAKLEMNSSGQLQKYFDELRNKLSFCYKYEGIEECIRQYEKISVQRKVPFEIKRYQYLFRMMVNDYAYYEENAGVFEKDLSGEIFSCSWDKYIEIYAMAEYVIYELQRNFQKVQYPENGERGRFRWIKDSQINMGYWNEIINNSEEELLVVMESNYNGHLSAWVCQMLKVLGKKVILIKKPMQYQNDTIDIQQTVAISIGNIKGVGGKLEIVPIEILKSSGEVQSNIEYILRYLYKKYSEGKGFHLLASGWQTEELCLQQKGEVRSFRLSACTADVFERTFALSYYGEYLTYISKIYQTDCKKLLEQTTTKKFSIVIPARNSAYTLEHTIRTCLEQRFKGEYEIIISDNSTGNNTEVYELCQRLNNPKIVYIKTPRDLHLPKSFEYAYLHTKGEYVLAIGSDDGILPWTLEILDAVTSAYPNEKIIQWERGFYAWPGFNGGQQHQFIVPAEYEKGKLHLFYRERDTYLKAVIDNPNNMYMLPMLYINSCFKREYMCDLIHKTGRLWDGICQDIYMGVVTALTNSKILNMNYPLSIAGMSSGSVGAKANKGSIKEDELTANVARVQMDNNVGGFCTTYIERLIPDMGTDINSLYNCLLRMVSIGVLPEEELWEKLDWQKVFMNLYKGIDVRDIAFDKKIHEMRYAASKHGDEFLKWFDEEIYNASLESYIYDEEVIKKSSDKKTYTEGEIDNGGCILDASKKGVSNIYEATLLFTEIANL